MPLTGKGKKIMEHMRKQYGPEKAKEVFYASENKGTIKGVHKKAGNTAISLQPAGGALAGLGVAGIDRLRTGSSSAQEIGGAAIGGTVGADIGRSIGPNLGVLLSLLPADKVEAILHAVRKHPRISGTVASTLAVAPAIIGAEAGRRVGSRLADKSAAATPATQFIANLMPDMLMGGMVGGLSGAIDPETTAGRSAVTGIGTGAGFGAGWQGGRLAGNSLANRLGGYGSQILASRPGAYHNPKIAALAAILAPMLGSAAAGVGAYQLMREKPRAVKQAGVPGFYNNALSALAAVAPYQSKLQNLKGLGNIAGHGIGGLLQGTAKQLDKLPDLVLPKQVSAGPLQRFADTLASKGRDMQRIKVDIGDAEEFRRIYGDAALAAVIKRLEQNGMVRVMPSKRAAAGVGPIS